MADFRKWVLALTVLTLFAGMAAAQNSNNPFTCQVNASATPQLRSEGLTELVGDIVLLCTGGQPLPPGAQIPTANVTVYMNGTVTSRLLGSANLGSASEALLLIDDPGVAPTGTLQYGNTVAQTPCTNVNNGAGVNGCLEFVGNQGTTPANGSQLSATMNLGVPVSGSAASGTPGANVFQGVVSGSSVTFYGIPVQPPVTSGATRTYRITNVRINANGITGGGPIPANAVAALAITGSTVIPLVNSTLTVGYISQSLSTNVLGTDFKGLSSSGKQYQQCNGVNKDQPGYLSFSELQGSAFKVRGPVVSSTSTTTAAQNVPGQPITNESGFVTGLFTGNGNTAGLADWGTRLKAVFSNIPSGVTVYVGTINNGGALLTTSSYAALVSSETVSDGSSFVPNANWNGSQLTPMVPGTTGLPLVTKTGTTGGVDYVQLSSTGGTAVAVWEVLSSLPSTIETFNFPVFISYSPNTANNIPPAPSSMQVNLSYAPTPAQGAFSATAGGQASSSLGIPRFADTSAAKNVLNIVICQTALLYPYVINTNGFDTGLAVANTTADPFGTTAQQGYCSIYWYGSTAPSTNPGFLGSAGYQTTTPTSSQLIQAGTVQAWGASVVAPGFSGYVIAVCNFQYAHGFAFVSDLGARNLAMGYLAEIMNAAGGQLSGRGPQAESLAH